MVSRRKRIAITGAVLAVLLLISVIVIPRLLTRNHELRAALASALQVSADRQQDFFLNLPPAQSRYPGSILATSKLLVLDASDANTPDIHTGSTFQLTTDDAVAASALGSLSVPALRDAAESKQAIALELRITNGKVLEMDVPQLKQRLLASNAARNAANKGTDPLIITRAYSGQLTFVLHRRSTDAGELWSRVSRSAQTSSNDRVHIAADRATAGELSVEVVDPVIFAFEASAASFITNHLGVEPSDVQLRPVKPSDIQPTSTSSRSNHAPWVLATIASGYYPSLRTLRQDWNAQSAALVRQTLAEYSPNKVHTLDATEEKPLSAPAIARFIQSMGQEARAPTPPLIIAYYVGHVLTWPSGGIALVLGTAKAIPEFATSANKTALDNAFGANIGDLARLAATLSANTEALPEGFLPLRDLYAELSQLGAPFALIVDGCLRMDEFERAREDLHITSDPGLHTFLYVGPDGNASGALSQLGMLLTHVADNQPFLHTSNPVILAAKPGTYAFASPNPDVAWNSVGPLAARITHYFRGARFDPDRPTLANVIQRVVDFTGVGEIDPKGSISWSNFSTFHARAAEIAYPE